MFRIGGDEFAAILTGEDFSRRNESVEELRNAYEVCYGKTDSNPWERYSAAVGMAEHATDDNSYELVFKRADALMYEEKKVFKEKCGSDR